MAVDADQHGGFLDLCRIVRFDDVYDVETTHHGVTLLPAHARVRFLDFLGDGFGELATLHVATAAQPISS